MTTKPANESDIKYAVITILRSGMNKICGMIAKAIISGANPIPSAIEDRRIKRDRKIVASSEIKHRRIVRDREIVA
jgi:hypothetical protein